MSSKLQQSVVRLLSATVSILSVFGSVAAAGIPAGYVELPCVYNWSEGGGDATYLDTGYTPEGSDFGFYMDFVLQSEINSWAPRFMGSARSTSTGGIVLSTWQEKPGGQLKFCSAETVDPHLKTGQRMQIELKNHVYTTSDGFSATLEGAEEGNFYGSVYVGTVHAEELKPCARFALYRYKIYKGDEVLHDFVPVIEKAAGLVGVYDVVGDKGFRAFGNSANISVLTIAAQPGGSVAVTTNGVPVGSVRDQSQTILVVADTKVVLKPTVDGDSIFLGWSGILPPDTIAAANTMEFTVAGSQSYNLVAGFGRRPPDGYQIIKSIISAEGDGAYFDTDYTPTGTDFGFYMDFVLQSEINGSGHRIMGSAETTSKGGIILSAYQSLWGGQLFFCSGEIVDPHLKTGQRMQIELKNSTYKTSTGFSTALTGTETGNFYGSVYVGTVHAKEMKRCALFTLYRYKIYKGDEVMHDFVPVVERATGTVGVYDVVGDKGFRASSTSTPFKREPMRGLVILLGALGSCF